MRCGECRACEDLVIWFGLHQSCGNRGSVGPVSVFWLWWRRGVGRGVGLESGGVGWCYVWIICVYDRSMDLCIVLGGYLRIYGAPSVQSCCTLWMSAS